MHKHKKAGRSQTAKLSPATKLANMWRENRDLLKCCAIYAAVVILAFSLVTTTVGNRLCLEPMNQLTAKCSAWCLRSLGLSADAVGTRVLSDLGGVDIKEGCNSIYVTILFLAGIAAYPAGLSSRLLGFALGAVAFFAINLIRVGSLYVLNIYYPALFHEAHQYAWQFIILIFGGLLWCLWYDRIVKRKTDRQAL